MPTYLWPFNAPDSWNLNVAKFKAYTMGLTLACKNWQGAHPSPFQGYCRKWPDIDSLQKLEKVINRECINPKVHEAVEANFKLHTGTIPQWDTPDVPRDDPGYVHVYHYDTLCMELWAHRTIDNHAASPMGLHIVEGIYGRDGDFNMGPNPFGNENSRDPWSEAPIKEGRAWDYMTNIVIFGKHPYLVDIVGHWLGGHEPGNFGLFHIAMERGKLNVMNPMSIPVYEWQDGVAIHRPLTSFTRTPLRTSYLHQYRKKEPLDATPGASLEPSRPRLRCKRTCSFLKGGAQKPHRAVETRYEFRNHPSPVAGPVWSRSGLLDRIHLLNIANHRSGLTDRTYLTFAGAHR